MDKNRLGEAIENRSDYNAIIRVMELLKSDDAKITVETSMAEESVQLERINFLFRTVLAGEATRLEREFELM